MSEKEGLTTSEDTQVRTKYTEVEQTKKPKVSVERHVNKQREGNPRQ